MQNSMTCLILNLFPYGRKIFLQTIILTCVFFIKPVHAFEICGDIRQGEMIVIKKSDQKELMINSKKLVTDSEGSLAFALGRDEKAFFEIENIKIPVQKTKWDIQSVQGVPQNKVTVQKQDEAAVLRERNDVGNTLKNIDLDLTYWKSSFIRPIEGRISGQFGNQRIFNGIKKNPHTGQDIAAPEGTPVKASAGGKVLLSGGDYFYSGNVVVLDHGYGLQTIYAHLQKSNVKKGEFVNQGDIIGFVGQTGRATGPHLHWGASLYNVRFNPQSLLTISQMSCVPFEDFKDKNQ